MFPTQIAQLVKIDYTNWRGERRERVILPMRFDFGATEWHPDEQWLCWAQDQKDNSVKAFALRNIHSWEPHHAP